MADPQFWRAGHALKERLADLVERVSGVRPDVFFGSYWGSQTGYAAQYNLLFHDECQTLAFGSHNRMVQLQVEDWLEAADPGALARCGRVAVKTYYRGQPNLPPLYRED